MTVTKKITYTKMFVSDMASLLLGIADQVSRVNYPPVCKFHAALEPHPKHEKSHTTHRISTLRYEIVGFSYVILTNFVELKTSNLIIFYPEA